MGDLLWRDANAGTVVTWFMNGAAVASTASFGAVPGTWTILGDADGTILWRDSAGDIALWGIPNGQVTSADGLGTVTSNFVVQGVGDFNGDGFLRHSVARPDCRNAVDLVHQRHAGDIGCECRLAAEQLERGPDRRLQRRRQQRHSAARQRRRSRGVADARRDGVVIARGQQRGLDLAGAERGQLD